MHVNQRRTKEWKNPHTTYWSVPASGPMEIPRENAIGKIPWNFCPTLKMRSLTGVLKMSLSLPPAV
jgi:hypothetical protein